MKLYTYLALGDSYSIGEQVPVFDSFPYQTVLALRKQHWEIASPEIVAVSGYTTDELANTIAIYPFLKQYDFVSLLIGVNNQYREKPLALFASDFEQLIQRAIELAGGSPRSVFVLSIPDWGVTPFAADRDPKKIAEAINAFNDVCQHITLKYQANFLDITDSQRADGNQAEFLAADRLHPSAKEYAKWATKLSDQIKLLI